MKKFSLEILAANDTVDRYEAFPVAMATNSPRLEGETSRAQEGRRYADVLCLPTAPTKLIPLKSITYLHGEPKIIWEEDEVKQMIIKENLAFTIIGKFLYGCPAIQDLRKVIPKQCEFKGECNIELLSNRHVLIRASCLEDYVHLLSKPVFYLMIGGWFYAMRTLK